MEKPDLFDLGLSADLQMWQRSAVGRRGFLKLVGLAGLAAALAACQSPDDATSAPGSSADPTTATGSSGSADICVDEIPSETAGPFPADGSQASNQSLNALALAGIVRPDIRTSLGTGNTAEGIPCNIELTLVDSGDGCTPLADHAIYLWHCDRDGDYSMYSSAAVDEDYLRGVQVTDANGVLTFNSIFPGCYAGRWPHAHFEIYPSLDVATNAGNALHTTQLAYPEDVCNEAYAAAGYEQSVRNLAGISLESDNVFRDGVGLQMGTVTGDANSGYTIRLSVGVDT